MDLLPELWIQILEISSSKTRSITCQVSKSWYSTSLSISKRLSSVSDLYYVFPPYDAKIHYRRLYRSGDYHLIVRLKKKYVFSEHICAGNNIDVVKLMISICLTDWNGGLLGACSVGNLEIAELMILHGAFSYNQGLLIACQNGHLGMVNLMISKGANDWNGGLREACRGNHLELAKLMISLGANDWNFGLYVACEGGSYQSAELLISKGANDWNRGLLIACIYNRAELVKLMILKGATLCRYCFESMEDHIDYYSERAL